jgi:hypothetical protein
MPWNCRMVDERGADYVPQTGDMFYRYAPDVWRALVKDWRAKGAQRDAPMVKYLSDEYLAERIDQRPPLTVILPGDTWFCVDSNATGERRGWQVSGEPPHITVSPSINCEGVYHGFLTNGVIGNDVEGRTFP